MTPPTGQTMPGTLNTGWNYICTGNFNGAGRLTINGTNVASSGTQDYNWVSDLYLGSNGTGQFFNGQITSFRVSNGDVNGIGGGGGCAVPTQPLTATPGITLLLLNAISPSTVLTDTSGNGAVNSGIRPPSYSQLSPF